jgi:hypothetical protein
LVTNKEQISKWVLGNNGGCMDWEVLGDGAHERNNPLWYLVTFFPLFRAKFSTLGIKILLESIQIIIP